MVLVKKFIFLSCVFLDQIGPQKVFHGLLDRKLAFLDHSLFFKSNRPIKRLSWRSRWKISLSRWKNKELEKWKNLHFGFASFLFSICQIKYAQKYFYDILDRNLAFLDD